MSDPSEPKPEPITHGPDPYPQKRGPLVEWLTRATERLARWITERPPKQ